MATALSERLSKTLRKGRSVFYCFKALAMEIAV